MWAALSLQVAVPVPFPAANRLSTGVPRKYQLYSQLRNLDATEQNQQIRKKSQTKNRQEGAEEQVEEEEEEKRGNSKQKLTGFDVLQALEKARARKMKKQRNGANSLLNSRKVIGERKKGTPENSALADYGNNNQIVRALSIKEDWGTRLDELEKRLQQLVDTTPAA